MYFIQQCIHLYNRRSIHACTEGISHRHTDAPAANYFQTRKVCVLKNAVYQKQFEKEMKALISDKV